MPPRGTEEGEIVESRLLSSRARPIQRELVIEEPQVTPTDFLREVAKKCANIAELRARHAKVQIEFTSYKKNAQKWTKDNPIENGQHALAVKEHLANLEKKVKEAQTEYSNELNSSGPEMERLFISLQPFILSRNSSLDGKISLLETENLQLKAQVQEHDASLKQLATENQRLTAQVQDLTVAIEGMGAQLSILSQTLHKDTMQAIQASITSEDEVDEIMEGGTP